MEVKNSFKIIRKLNFSHGSKQKNNNTFNWKTDHEANITINYENSNKMSETLNKTTLVSAFNIWQNKGSNSICSKKKLMKQTNIDHSFMFLQMFIILVLKKSLISVSEKIHSGFLKEKNIFSTFQLGSSSIMVLAFFPLSGKLRALI